MSDDLEKRLNWLRAAVLGANDGVLSLAGVVIGLASAGADRSTILLGGLVALTAGAISMSGGEYASVAAQKDSEVAHGKDEDSINAHPLAAALSSFIAFTIGGLIPLITIILETNLSPIWLTGASVVFTLTLTGYWAAWFGRSSKVKGSLRNLFISLITVLLSYGAGLVIGLVI